MAEDDGVLGNLPRSRPGRRSEKRAAGASKPRAAARPKPPPAPTPRAPEPETDPVGDALRTVGGLAAGGARVAQGVAREVLRRIPRP